MPGPWPGPGAAAAVTKGLLSTLTGERPGLEVSRDGRSAGLAVGRDGCSGHRPVGNPRKDRPARRALAVGEPADGPCPWPGSEPGQCSDRCPRPCWASPPL